MVFSNRAVFHLDSSTTQKRQVVAFDIDIGGPGFLVDLLYLRSIGQSFDMSFLNDDVFEDRSAYRIQVFFPPFLQSSVNTLHQYRVFVGSFGDLCPFFPLVKR